VANFFPSIHKQTLWEILTRKIRHPELVWLTQTLLFHDPTTNYGFQSRGRPTPGPESRDYSVPPHKSLFGRHNERGLPIGNLTSQFWGNVYLNELDHFVKRTLKCRYYLRYVDDMVLLAADKETLSAWQQAIAQFLQTRLKLALRPDMLTPFQIKKGIDFVGWKTWWNRRVPRRRTLSNVYRRLKTFERLAVRPAWDGVGTRIDLRHQDRPRRVDFLQATLASYAGHLRHGAAWRAWIEIWKRYPWLQALFVRQGWLVTERWPRRAMTRAFDIRSQYWSLARQADPEALLFCQVGKFVEFYGPQRLVAAPVLNLHTAALSRAGEIVPSGGRV